MHHRTRQKLGIVAVALGLASSACGPPEASRGDARPAASPAMDLASPELAAARAFTRGFEHASDRLARAVGSVDPASLQRMLRRYAGATDKLLALEDLNRDLERALVTAEQAETLDYRIVFYASDVETGWRAVLDPGTRDERILYHGTAPFRGMGAAKVLTEEIAIPNRALAPGRHEVRFELLPRPRGYFAADVEVLASDGDGRAHSVYRWRIVGRDDLVDLERVGDEERAWYRLEPFVFHARVAPESPARLAAGSAQPPVAAR